MRYPLGDWLHNKISRQEYKEKMAIYRDKQSQYVAKRLFGIYGFEIAQKYIVETEDGYDLILHFVEEQP